MDCQAWLFLWCYMELSTSRCLLLSSPNCFEFPPVLKSPPQIMIVRKISVINLNNNSCNFYFRFAVQMLRFLKQMEMNGNVTLQLSVVVDRGGFPFDKAS